MIVDYRKMANGKEYIKILDKTRAVSVLLLGPIQTIESGRIIVTSNLLMIRDYLHSEAYLLCSEAEFEKHFNIVKVKLDQFINVKKNRY